MNVLCVGDLHFQENNLEQCDILISKIIKVVRQFKPDVVVFLGDTLHTHEMLYTPAVNRAVKLFRTVSKLTKTFVLIGNHDYINPLQYQTDEHGFNAFKYWDSDITIVDKVTKYVQTSNDEEYVFFLVPYVPNGRFKEALDSSDEIWSAADAIFAHNDFYGRTVNGKIFEDGDKWDDSYPPIINGHIHTPQYVEPNIYCIGSAMQQNFGEEYDKRLWLITFDHDEEEAFSYKKINLKMQRKVTLNVNIDEIDSIDLAEYTNDQVKLVINSTSEQFQAFKKTKQYKAIQKTCKKIGHKAIVNDTENTLEEYKKFEKKGYRDILFGMIKNDNLQQRIFTEATGEKYYEVDLE